MAELNKPESVYLHELTVPAKAIDGNGHVNNVAYVQWMQDVAILHWESLGGMEIDHAENCTWVARSHHIEYLRPAYEDEVIQIRTWIDNVRRVRSVRKYEFKRLSDDQLLARGETDWVFIDVDSGRPKPIPGFVGENILG